MVVVRIIILIAFLVLFSATALAYLQVGNPFDISTTSGATPFWSLSSNPQDCLSEQMENNSNCQSNWTINASSSKNSFLIKVKFNSTSTNVTEKETQTFNITIFEKGDNGRIMMDNESCVGCAFLIVNDTNTSTAYDNPFSCGNMTSGSNCTIDWNVSANGPLKSEWDMFVNFSFNSTTGKQKQTDTIKARIVDYKWDDITGYINSSWNCRKQINFTPNVTDSGRVEIRGFGVDSCRPINCTREFRVSRILSNDSHQYIPFISIENEDYQSISAGGVYFTYCRRVDIIFNTSLIANQSNKFLVYFNKPLAEIDYSNPTGSVLFNESYLDPDKVGHENNENVWNGLFDSHIDIWWRNSSDNCSDQEGCSPGGSLTFRSDANDTFNSLKSLNYNPQVYPNRYKNSFDSTIFDDSVYAFFGHGDLSTSGNVNQTAFEVSVIDNLVYANNISNLSSNIQAKLVMSISSFGGDTNTTLTGCTLNNWLSKAFTEKGAGCYLGFLGRNTLSSCNNCSCSSDVMWDETDDFNKCFWGNMTTNNSLSIRDAAELAKECSKKSGQGCENDDCVHYVLVNSTINGCDLSLKR